MLSSHLSKQGSGLIKDLRLIKDGRQDGSAKVRPKHLPCPLVSGWSAGHKSRPSMLTNGTWGNNNNNKKKI